MEIEKVSGRYVVDGKLVTADQFLAISQENARRVEELEDRNDLLSETASALSEEITTLNRQNAALGQALAERPDRFWSGIIAAGVSFIVGLLIGSGAVTKIGDVVMSVLSFVLGLAAIIGVIWLLYRLYQQSDDKRSSKPTNSQSRETEEPSEQSPGPARTHQAEEVQDEDQATGNSVMDRLSRYESHAPHGYKPLSGDDVSSETEPTEQEPESKPSLLERMLAGSE